MKKQPCEKHIQIYVLLPLKNVEKTNG